MLYLLIGLSYAAELVHFSNGLYLGVYVDGYYASEVYVQVLVACGVRFFVFDRFSVSPSRVCLLFAFALASVCLYVLSSCVGDFFVGCVD